MCFQSWSFYLPIKMCRRYLAYAGLLICCLVEEHQAPTPKSSIFASEIRRNIFQKWLQHLHEERSYDTILIAYNDTRVDSRLQSLLQYAWPKVLLTPGQRFDYKERYNSEILVIITMSNKIDEPLMEATAGTLNFVRGARVLMLALNIKDEESFKNASKALCQKYKMTNVLLKFHHKLTEELLSDYYQLKPYPQYHWLMQTIEQKSEVYFPVHWRNMQKGIVVTQTDQVSPRSLFFLDSQGNWKMNGYVARFVLLFAEHFNATLQWYKPLKVGEVIHFMLVNKLVDDNLVDIPMALMISEASSEWAYRSYVYQIEDGRLLVPCAQQFSLKEVFSVLLDVRFFGLVIFCTVFFSLLHSLIDYMFDGIRQPVNALLSDRVFPAVLGLSFVARNAPWRVLKLVYIILSFLGINTTCQFSATMNSLFTSHPYHRQIETLADIRDSPLKINILKGDLNLMGGTLLDIFRSLITTENVTHYAEMRDSFNASTGYYANLGSWRLLNLKQQLFTQKVYCSYDNLTVFRIMPWTFQLQQHSQYKEAMDYLIHQVHAMGLVDAWYASTFSDLVKLKQISLLDPNPRQDVKPMTAGDLYWAWLILVMGMSISGMVFIAERWYYQQIRYLE
uniref:Ionotropic glutamate receptor C-terminal domain-containing protein n=1 Tax=Stomoxys calcitrans TaxID=35570 RepID=A0A1I8NM33_STOCA